MAKESPTIPFPRENPHLFGHEAAQAQFLREAERGMLHHAYLMTGPKGIGKATLAYRFARYLLNRGAVQAKPEEAPSFSLFGDEPALVVAASSTSSLDMPADSALFRRIAGGTHTDLLVLAPPYDDKKHAEKTIITIDEARKVPEFLSLTPAESDWRVVIVDAVDQLNVNAANALLKILEEPPARAILFLICHNPGAILPTIRSRCRLFTLQSPNAPEFEQILGQVAPHIMLHDYAPLFALSGGSPGYAITLAANDGVEWYRRWVDALQPDATAATRQAFADKVAAQKAAETWRTVLHGFDLVSARIALWPHVKPEDFVIDGEGDKLGRIAATMTPEIRAKWRARSFELLTTTDIFNLDKRQTIAMLLSPELLDAVAA